MKKLGLVGGIGYLSTLEYYKVINEEYNKRFISKSKNGEYPTMVIESLNLAVAYELVEKKDWKKFTEMFLTAIKNLVNAGAEFAAIAANTAHIVFDEVQKQSSIPIIGIVDEVCKTAKAKGYKKLIIFGTGFTMSSGMYESKCLNYGLNAIAPNKYDQEVIHNIIFPNLEAGLVLEEEKNALLDIARKMLVDYKADALVLGCTELPLAINKGDLGTEILDTGVIHVNAILDYFASDHNCV